MMVRGFIDCHRFMNTRVATMSFDGILVGCTRSNICIIVPIVFGNLIFGFLKLSLRHSCINPTISSRLSTK